MKGKQAKVEFDKMLMPQPAINFDGLYEPAKSAKGVWLILVGKRDPTQRTPLPSVILATCIIPLSKEGTV